MKNPNLLCLVVVLLGTSCCVGQEQDETLPNDRVINCLKRSGSFGFSKASMQDIASEIEQQFDINVVVEKRAFEEIGLDDPRISFEADSIQLRSALLLMLEPLELTYVVHLEAIVLTTQQSADDNWRAVVYNVTDLIDAARPSLATPSRDAPLPELVDFASLITLIEISVRPDTWSAGSGPSSDCLSMMVKDKKLLIIRQSEHGHLDIENLLASIRREMNRNRHQVSTEQSIAPKPPS